MSLEYATERLRLFGSLPSGMEAVRDGSPWTLMPERLRFRHGASLADLKVPYHLGSGDESIVEASVLGLGALIKKRYEIERESVIEDASRKDRSLYVKTPNIRDKTFRLDIFTPMSFERGLAARILENTPYIDSALLFAWLGHGESGGRFVEWLRTMVKKAREEELHLGLEEQTSYLTLLVLMKDVRKHLLRLKEFRIKGFSYDKLDLAVGLTFFNVFAAVIDELTGEWSEDDSVGLVLRSALLPGRFITVKSGLLGTSKNPYDLSLKTYEALRGHLVPLTGDTESPDLLVEEGLRRVRGDKALLEEVMGQSRILRFREKVLEYMKSYDIPDKSLRKDLFDIYNEDRLISNLLKDGRYAAAIAERIEAIIKIVAKDRDRAGKLVALQALVLESGGKRRPILGLGGAKPRDNAAITAIIKSFYALGLDEMAGETVELMMGLLVDRREKVPAETLRDKYQKGRLYRFSIDKRAMIKGLEAREEGQLFVDMKDFSRKTHKIKELAMADFMKEHFFKPILDAAREHMEGEGLGESGKGIRLTNIPGDAIIFSGAMRPLVSLARDIRRIIEESGRELDQRLPAVGGREVMERVHERFEERRAALRKKRLDLITGMEAGREDSTEAMLRLSEEESGLERIYKEELEAAIKYEMEAGLFITYGAKAEVIELGFSRGYKGPVSVSIGEKINEASRGTYRHPMVRAYLEILLSADRERRRNKDIQYPFDVYIHTAYTLRMPPELEHAFDKLISGRKLTNAQALSRLITENYLKDFEKIIAGESFSSLRLITSVTDIYNKGQALSDEALTAYIKESRGEKRFYRRIMARDELHESIREAFFLPRERMEFVFTATREKGLAEIFYRAGELTFRGFEAAPPCGVYEMLNPEGEFFNVLWDHHIGAWIEEAKDAGEEPL